MFPARRLDVIPVNDVKLEKVGCRDCIVRGVLTVAELKHVACWTSAYARATNTSRSCSSQLWRRSQTLGKPRSAVHRTIVKNANAGSQSGAMVEADLARCHGRSTSSARLEPFENWKRCPVVPGAAYGDLGNSAAVSAIDGLKSGSASASTHLGAEGEIAPRLSVTSFRRLASLDASGSVVTVVEPG